jgi:hypothetical protein
LFEKLETEFNALLKEELKQSESETKKSEAASVDPLVMGGASVNPGLTQPYGRPDNYGRPDLDPFGSDPLRVGGGGGGMIFDPFRGHNYPRVPGNLPPGSVPPGARFDPFGPAIPDDLTGLGTRPMRGGLVVDAFAFFQNITIINEGSMHALESVK